MARKILPLFFLFSLILSIGCGGKITIPASADPAVVRSGTVFLGDSITDRWGDLNAYFPGENYINAGIDGQRTDQILARLPDILSGANVCNGNPAAPLNCRSITPPATVVIYAGWNNLFQGTDPVLAIADIQNMVTLCQFYGVQPIVVTIYHFDPAFTGANFDPIIDGMNQNIRLIGVPTIDLEQVFLNQSGYTVDGVHPIAPGYAQMRDAYNVALAAPIQN